MTNNNQDVAQKPKKSIFGKASDTNGRFFNDEGKIIGSSPWFKASVVLFVISVLTFFSGITGFIEIQTLKFNANDSMLFVDAEWDIVNALPQFIAYFGWIFITPLIFSIIGFKSKKYSETKIALPVMSACIAILLIWALSLLMFA